MLIFSVFFLKPPSWHFFFRQILYLGFFPEIIHSLAGLDRLVTVTPDLVRDRVNLSSTDIEDEKVTDFIKDAEAAIEEETGVSMDYTICSQAEAAAIKNLAAIYCLVHMSGGSASGLSYSIGSLRVSESGPSLGGKAETLCRELERILSKLRQPYVGRA